MIALFAERDPSELFRREHASGDAHLFRSRAVIDISSGELDIFASERVGDIGGRQKMRVELRRIERDEECTLALTEELDRADAAQTLERGLQLVFHELSELLGGSRAADRDIIERCCVRIDLLNPRRIETCRELAENAVHAIAHLLSRDVNVLFELELDEDDQETFIGGRAELREP